MTKLLKCPFCLNSSIKAKAGPTICSDCNALFEIDDRLECIFNDPHNLRFSVVGTICASCGLIQDVSRERCSYCGVEIFAAVQ